MNVQSSTSLLMKAWQESLLTLPQVPFLALDSGNSPCMAINFWKIDLVFIYMGTSTKIRRTNTLYRRLCMGIVPSHFLNAYLYLLSHP